MKSDDRDDDDDDDDDAHDDDQGEFQANGHGGGGRYAARDRTSSGSKSCRRTVIITASLQTHASTRAHTLVPAMNAKARHSTNARRTRGSSNRLQFMFFNILKGV